MRDHVQHNRPTLTLVRPIERAPSNDVVLSRIVAVGDPPAAAARRADSPQARARPALSLVVQLSELDEAVQSWRAEGELLSGPVVRSNDINAASRTRARHAYERKATLRKLETFGVSAASLLRGDAEAQGRPARLRTIPTTRELMQVFELQD